MRSTEEKKELYQFVGQPELLVHGMQTERFLVATAEDVRHWLQKQTRSERIATFVVDALGSLWIADRRSEHIACARGGRVQTAGELEFEAGENGVEVVGATNQSTGFCPRVESWHALELALNAASLAHPPAWTTAFEFRRCEQCGELNVVKDAWFVCCACDADLPTRWNIGTESSD